MAYTAVPTQNTGDLWTAANHNTYIRDNFAAGVPDIFTAKGDLAVATAANTATNRAVGTNGQILTADSAESDGVKWASISGGNSCAARYEISGSTANSALANASAEIIDFDTSDFDTDTAVTTGASWKFTVPTGKGGKYLVMCNIALASDTNWGENELFRVGVYVGGVLQAYLGSQYMHAAASGGFEVHVNGSTVLDLSAADEVDFRAYQNSGSAINFSTDGDFCHCAIIKFYN